MQRHSEDQAMAKTRSVDRQRYWQATIERHQASGQSIVGFRVIYYWLPLLIAAAMLGWNEWRLNTGQATQPYKNQ
jgi:uncharacterized membrane protein YbhN (UPF0104 family)